MYYDVYKLGFSYYSDQYIPYSILNAIAAKYVITYRCIDFFLDELVRPDKVKSPLIRLFTEEEKKKKNEKKGEDVGKEVVEKEKFNPMKTSRNRFAKFKSYNMTSSKSKEMESETAGKDTEKEITMNRFIQLGKIANFSFLQKPVLVKKTGGFNSDLQKGLFDNSDVQKEVFSYRDFKLAMQSPSSFTK
jgi:hypothetical protein